MYNTFNASLHNHTDFSNIRLRDCTNKVESLVQYANELGHNAIAITEHDFTGGWLKAKECEEKIREKNPHFKVILGNEIYLCRNGLNAENFRKDIDKYYHFILLAKDEIGAKQIQEISTRAWLRSYIARGMRRVPTYYQDLVDVIGNNKGHVLGSSACLGGALGTQLLRYCKSKDNALMTKIENWIDRMAGIFGDGNFYLEMQPSLSNEQTYVNAEIVRLSQKKNIPYIITCDAHYLSKSDREVHKAFLNSQDGDREVDEFYAYTYLMSTEEVTKNCKLTAEQLQEAYKNIDSIVNCCEDYSLNKPLKIPELTWKEFVHDEEEYKYYNEHIPNLKMFHESTGKADNELVWAIIDGIKHHEDLQNEAAYHEIDEDLKVTWDSSVVNKAYWSAYFLNLQKIIDVCWEAGSIVGPGRGSGVGFLLLYVLDITQINPMREKTKTFRWRFLNPERVSVLD